MGNPFQDQLLKAGVVTKQQVKKAQSAFTEVQGTAPIDWEGAVLERGAERRTFRRLEL